MTWRATFARPWWEEYRHQHGMRCLKLPNTMAFAEVTVMADAVGLHAAVEAAEEGPAVGARHAPPTRSTRTPTGTAA
jgi:hypothetical protein